MRRWAPVLLLCLALPWVAQAKFADTQGFSGRHGVTCVSCHVGTPAGLVPPATASLDGLPAEYNSSARYAIRVRVAGGPSANPVPGQPRGGFDLEVDAGTLVPGPGMEGLLRFPHPNEATYTGAGTLRREWDLVWLAPNASSAPRSASFWLAVLSADGNHVMGGPDAVGERGDAAATLVASVPPSSEVVAEWAARPVPRPRLETPPAWPASGSPFTLRGSVSEDCDGAQWRLDGSAWSPAIGAPHFVATLVMPGPGLHVLEARALRGEAFSEPARIEFQVSGLATASQSSPALGAAWGLILLLPLLPAGHSLWRKKT